MLYNKGGKSRYLACQHIFISIQAVLYPYISCIKFLIKFQRNVGLWSLLKSHFNEFDVWKSFALKFLFSKRKYRNCILTLPRLGSTLTFFLQQGYNKDSDLHTFFDENKATSRFTKRNYMRVFVDTFISHGSYLYVPTTQLHVEVLWSDLPSLPSDIPPFLQSIIHGEWQSAGLTIWPGEMFWIASYCDLYTMCVYTRRDIFY